MSDGQGVNSLGKDDLSCGGQRCHPRTEFCEPYESSCHSCADLCSIDAKFGDCAKHCKPYLQDVLQYGKTNVVGPDLKSLQILLAVVLAVSLTVLILLLVLLTLKFRSSRRKSGSRIGLNDVVVSMSQVSPVRSSYPASNGAPPELVRGSLTTAPSMQTVSTNLTGSLRSRPSAVASGAGSGMRPTPSPDTSRNPGGAPNRGSSARTTSRVPTEDRVPENRNSYDNPGLDLSSGSSSQDAGIRQNGPGPAPYTISYSKVI